MPTMAKGFESAVRRLVFNTIVLCYLPQEESPLDSLGVAADTGVTLGEGDTTGALEMNVGDVLLSFVTERERSCGCATGCTGDCTAN